MLAIVTGHLWTTHAWVRPVLFTWHVPIFFFLAGYLWNEHRGLAAEVRHRALTLLLPFVAWIVLLVLLVDHDHPAAAAHRVAQEAWRSQGFERPFWAFWFAPALFFAAVGYRVVSRLGWAPRCAVVLGSTVGLSFLAATDHRLPLNLAQGLVCTTWVLAGHALRRTEVAAELRWGRRYDVTAYRAPVGIALLLGAATWIALSGAALDLDLHLVDLGAPVASVLVSLMICTGLVLLGSGVAAESLPAATTDLARAALVVMLVHLAMIDQAGGFTHPGLGELVLVVAASWGVGLVLVALPRAGWLTGQRGIRARPAEISQRIPQPAPAHAE